MDLQRLQQLLSNMPGRGAPAPDTPAPDTSEKIQISSLSLLKMLKHGSYITLRTHLPSYLYDDHRARSAHSKLCSDL